METVPSDYAVSLTVGKDLQNPPGTKLWNMTQQSSRIGSMQITFSENKASD